jgi:hypothetical protein
MIAHYEEICKNTHFMWYIAIFVAVFGEQKVPGIGKWSWYLKHLQEEFVVVSSDVTYMLGQY